MKVTLAEILARAQTLLKDGDASHALREIEHIHKKMEPTKYALNQLVIELARRVQSSDPTNALALLGHVLKRSPGDNEANVLVACLYDRLGNQKQARECASRVLHSPAAKAEQQLISANLMVRLDDDSVSIEVALKAFESLGRPLKWAAAMLYIALRCAHWTAAQRLIQQLKQAYAEGGRLAEIRESPRTHVLWCDDEPTNIEVLSDWSKRHLYPKHDHLVPEPLGGRKIKVGYLSSDFREHPTARLVNGLLRHHDHSRFELHMYCSGWDDCSPMRREVESHFDQVHRVTNLSDEDAAALIRSHGIDVLVELNGPTRANRMGILAQRAAPVQIDYLGWPGSVGGRVVDYVVGDAYTVPKGAEKIYPERVIRIERIYQVNDYAARTLPPVPSRASMGLPEDVIVIGMFNAINKVRGEVWAVWMEILKAVPNSILWILDPGKTARKNIGKYTKALGVDPKRILAAPGMVQDAHLARLQCCDLMLDPWPYGGHTSTSDALFAGIPVVALKGNNFASRVSSGLLTAAGLQQLVATDLQAYGRLATHLLRYPEELAKVKQFIKNRTPKLDVFDAAGKARQFEQAYTYAVQRSIAGKQPVHINIQHDGGDLAHSKVRNVAVSGQPLTPTRATNGESSAVKLPLMLVCGPWSSGTSAVAGVLASAGLPAPGPYVAVNDPRTRATYEMKAFQAVLRGLASEQTLQKLTTPAEALQRLQQFRDEILCPGLKAEPAAAPVMLKHGLAPLFLDELCALFDVRIVGVLRPLQAIEATRVRRKWFPSLGRKGAEVIYRALFDHLVNAGTPFHLVRYPALLAEPAAEFDKLMTFCGVSPNEAQRKAALAFVDRPTRINKAKD